MWLHTVFIMLFAQLTNCAQILVVLPSPLYSHNIIYRTIYKELSSRGHHLVVFTPDPLKDSQLINVKEIDLGYLYAEIDTIPREFYTGIGITYHDIYLKIARKVLTHPEMNKLVKNPGTKFDLVLIEWNASPSLGILSKIFNCPMIGMRAKGLSLDGHDYIGNPTNPAYIPNGLTDFDGNFLSRVDNFLFGIKWRINYHFYVIPNAQKLINELYPDYSQDVLQLQKDVSLILTNTHPVFTGVRPIVPANIEIGGIHLRKEMKSLPKDILDFLEDATEGAVYVNLGSHTTNIPHLTPNVIKIVTSALSQLPYKIIWRWEKMDSEVDFGNAFVSKWLPQQAILGHPNVKVFITNGGLQSFLEAVDNKVPLVGIPLFADQYMNARRMEALKIGKRLDVKSLNRKILINAIIKVAQSPRYRKNIVRASTILHDLPLKPLDKAVWWVEYVLRHKGARHFRSAAIDMDWITYLLLDVFAFMAMCFLVALTLAYYLIVGIRRGALLLRYKLSKVKTE